MPSPHSCLLALPLLLGACSLGPESPSDVSTLVAIHAAAVQQPSGVLVNGTIRNSNEYSLTLESRCGKRPWIAIEWWTGSRWKSLSGEEACFMIRTPPLILEAGESYLFTVSQPVDLHPGDTFRIRVESETRIRVVSEPFSVSEQA